MLGLLGYFAIGFVLDLAITLHLVAVQRDRPVSATFLSVVITLISLLIVQNIVVDYSFFKVLAYAIGNGIGTLTVLLARRYLARMPPRR